MRQTGNLGEQSAEQLVGGAAGVINGAVEAGAKIGQSIIDGALRPFGQSGASLSQFAGQVTRTLQDALSSGLDALGRGAGLAGKLAGTAVGLATAGAGALAGGALGLAVGNAPGALIGASLGSLAGVALMKGLEDVSGAVGGVLGALGTAIGKLGETAAGAFKTITDVVQDVTTVAGQLARQVGSIRAYTGLGAASAAGLIMSYGAFGLNPQGIAARTDPAISHMMNGAMGAPGYADANFLPGYAARFQELQGQGLIGRMMARRLASQSGMDSPEGMWFSQLPASQIQGQLAYQSNIQRNLGMSPEGLRRAGEDLPLLQLRVTGAVEAIKLKLFDLASPTIVAGLDTVTKYIGQHAGDIGNALKSGVNWLTTEMPQLVVAGFSIVKTGAINFALGLVDVGHSFAALLRSFEAGNGGLLGVIGGFLRGMDYISVGANGFEKLIFGIGAVIYDVSVGIANAALLITKAFAGIALLPSVVLEHLPVIGPALRSAEKGSLRKWADAAIAAPFAQFQNPFDVSQYTSGTTDYSGQFDNFRKSGKFGNAADAMDNAGSALAQHLQGLKASTNEGNFHLSRIAKGVEDTAANTQLIANHTQVLNYLHQKAAQGDTTAQDLVADMLNRQKYQINRAISNLGG